MLLAIGIVVNCIATSTLKGFDQKLVQNLINSLPISKRYRKTFKWTLIQHDLWKLYKSYSKNFQSRNGHQIEREQGFLSSLR